MVEDEPRLREMLLTALPQMGFSASGVARAEEALQVMEQHPRSLILLDLNLPGMSGLELLDHLSSRWPATRVVVLTGFGDFDAARQAIRHGVVDFLTKPASLGDLERALERAQRRLERRPMLSTGPERPADAEAESAHQTLEELERRHILAALERHHGNRTAAARELGISLRTLYYRLARYQEQGFL